MYWIYLWVKTTLGKISTEPLFDMNEDDFDEIIISPHTSLFKIYHVKLWSEAPSFLPLFPSFPSFPFLSSFQWEEGKITLEENLKKKSPLWIKVENICHLRILFVCLFVCLFFQVDIVRNVCGKHLFFLYVMVLNHLIKSRACSFIKK